MVSYLLQQSEVGFHDDVVEDLFIEQCSFSPFGLRLGSCMKIHNEVDVMPLAQFFDYTLEYGCLSAFMDSSGDHADDDLTTTACGTSYTVHILYNLVAYRHLSRASLVAEHGEDSGYEDSDSVGDGTEGDFSVIGHKSDVKRSGFYLKPKRTISYRWTTGEVL